MPYFVPPLPFLHFFHIYMFILYIMSILCKMFHQNLWYPFFKANFVKIMNFCPNSFNLSDFATQIFEGMYLFFFLPFFCTIYGEWGTSMILFSPIKILGKKGKKRVRYTFWSKSAQNFKISIFSKNCPILHPFYPFCIFFT